MMNSVISIVANIVEALCFPVFTAEVFDIKYKKTYCLIQTVLQFLILQYFYDYSDSNLLLATIIVVVNVVPLILISKIIFVPILITLLYEGVLAGISISLYYVIKVLLVCGMQVEMIIPLVTIISKIILIIVTYFLIRNKQILDMSINKKEYSFIAAVQVIIIISLTVTGVIYFNNSYNENAASIVLLLQIIQFLSFVYTIYKMNTLNKEKIELERINQKNAFSIQKYSMMTSIKREVDNKNHMLFYIVYSIINLLHDNKIEEAKIFISNYMKQQIKRNILLDTKNDVFDFVVGMKLNELSENNTLIKVVCAIPNDSFYDDIRVINLMTSLIEENAKSSILNITLTDRNQFAVLSLEVHKDYKIDFNNLNEIINQSELSKSVVSNIDTQRGRITLSIKK